MSFVQSYHDRDVGIVCADGRVSVRFPDGSCAALPGQTAEKFVILRASPGLVLTVSSTASMRLEFTIYRAMLRYLQHFPKVSFDQAAEVIAPTAHRSIEAFPGKLFRLLGRRFFSSSDRVHLRLLGYDRGQMRIRSRVFSCDTNSSEQWEDRSGVTISGALEPGEGIVFVDKLIELIGRDPSPDIIRKAMLTLAAEISISRPATIGPPYCFCIVTRDSGAKAA